MRHCLGKCYIVASSVRTHNAIHRFSMHTQSHPCYRTSEHDRKKEIPFLSLHPRFLCGAAAALMGAVSMCTVVIAREHEGRAHATSVEDASFSTAARIPPHGDAPTPPAECVAAVDANAESRVWGVPYDVNWDGRHHEAQARGIDTRRKRLVRQILLVRHGEYVHAESRLDADRVLTERGRSQAHRVGLYLQRALQSNPLLTQRAPRRVYVSGLTRARETMLQILPNFAHTTPVVEVLDLNEGVPCAPSPALQRLETMSRPEQILQAQRAERAFQQIFYRPLSEEDVGVDIVVGHSNVFRYFLCRILQVPPEAWLRLTLGHCSVTRISIYSTGSVKVEAVGENGYLPPEMHTV